MGRFTSVFVSVALCAALGAVFADEAAASVGDKKSVKKFCKTALAIGNSGSTNPQGELEQDVAAAAERDYKKAAKLAPTKKIKKAANQVAKFYGKVADGESPTRAIQGDVGADYTEGLVVFSTYVTSKCLVSQLDDLPGR